MTKIKGWEKINENKWKHKELDFTTILDISGVGDTYWITRTFVVKGPRGGIKGMHEKTLKKVKGKSNAQKIAITYMKEHEDGR